MVIVTELEVKAKIKTPYQEENLHRNDKQNLWSGIGKKKIRLNILFRDAKSLLDYLMKYTFYIINFDHCWTRHQCIKLNLLVSISKMKNALFLLLVKYAIDND